jgi:Conserved hypothetical protein (DUF2461)
MAHNVSHEKGIWQRLRRVFLRPGGRQQQRILDREPRRLRRADQTFVRRVAVAYPDVWRMAHISSEQRHPIRNYKGAYKTFIGAVAEREDGVGAFVQMSGKGLLVGTGLPMPAPDQLTKLRSAIDAAAKVTASKAHVHGGRWDPLKRVPKGFPTDHPREELLRWKGIEVNHRPKTPAWLDTADAPTNVKALITLGKPIHDWLAKNVGPSAMTPEERFAPKKR